MNETERTIRGLIDIMAKSLLSTVRQTIAEPRKQIRVGITVHVGGQIFEKSLRSPNLIGNEPITERIKADIIT